MFKKMINAFGVALLFALGSYASVIASAGINTSSVLSKNNPIAEMFEQEKFTFKNSSSLIENIRNIGTRESG